MPERAKPGKAVLCPRDPGLGFRTFRNCYTITSDAAAGVQVDQSKLQAEPNCGLKASE